MKTTLKCIKTAAVSALFATSALLSTGATAIEGGDGGTVIQYASQWSVVQHLCSNFTCVNVRSSGHGWYVTWKV